MVEFQSESERRLFILAVVVFVLGALSIAILLTGNKGILFYLVIAITLILGFYFAYQLSRTESAKVVPQAAAQKKAPTRYR